LPEWNWTIEARRRRDMEEYVRVGREGVIGVCAMVWC